MKTRVISALIAVALVAVTFRYFKIPGLYVITSLVSLACIIEYSWLTFRRAMSPLHVRVMFVSLAALVYFIAVAWIDFALYAAAAASIVFLSVVLLTVRKSPDLPNALALQNAGLMGFLYCGVFPALAVRNLTFNNGSAWLFGLMAVVFSGDTFAYLAGRFFGRNKLLEPVSPKKTIEGSVGGLLGSAVAGALMQITFFPEIPLFTWVLLALVTGLFAQVGDLFESLLKRIADVKDSGSIMPGHGGALDRVDGILFAAPVYYVLARFLQ